MENTYTYEHKGYTLQQTSYNWHYTRYGSIIYQAASKEQLESVGCGSLKIKKKDHKRKGVNHGEGTLQRNFSIFKRAF